MSNKNYSNHIPLSEAKAYLTSLQKAIRAEKAFREKIIKERADKWREWWKNKKSMVVEWVDD